MNFLNPHFSLLQAYNTSKDFQFIIIFYQYFDITSSVFLTVTINTQIAWQFPLRKKNGGLRPRLVFG